jgi:ketosteroid isomerase-like protein
MLNSWKLPAALALALGLGGAASAAGPPPAPATPSTAPAVAKPAGPSDHAQIEALEKGFTAGLNAKNADKIMSYYARESLFVFDVTPPREHVGWTDYKKDFEGLFAAYPGPVTMQLSELSITVVGPVAYGHSVQDAHFTAADGTVTEAVVRVTDVYRKLGGKWKIVQEHVSVPVDLGTLKPDLLSKP